MGIGAFQKGICTSTPPRGGGHLCEGVRRHRQVGDQGVGVGLSVQEHTLQHKCRAMKQGMVFRYKWVYSKEDTMAHTHRLVVTS